MHKSPYLPKSYPIPDFPAGLVWLVGAGPGHPGLLTLEALSVLRQGDVIIYDALVASEILEWRHPDACLEYAGKRGGKASIKQRDISLRLIELSRQGKRIVRLKGGDPFIFGRGAEEAQTLIKAGVPIRVTPGISAGIGGLAMAGIPLTHRNINQSVTFLTGHDQAGLAPSSIDWNAVEKSSPVIVIYMAIKHLQQIACAIIDAGRSIMTPVAVVQNATLPDMRVLETTLGEMVSDVQAQGFGSPAIICIGENVRMRSIINWAEQLTEKPCDEENEQLKTVYPVGIE